MKVLAIVLALAVFGANAAPREDSDVAADVIATINKILEKIKEPLVDIHDIRYVVDLVVEKVSFTADDVVVKGIKNLDIKQMDYDKTTGRIDYDLTFGDITALVDLKVILSGLINLKHEPLIDVSLGDLKLAGYAVLDTAVVPNQLTDFKVLLTLGGVKVDLKNILNNDELTETLTTVLSESLPSIVDSIAVSLEPVVSPIAQSVINIVLRHSE